MNEWKIQGSRAYGNGQSYNCTNIVNAETLQNTLNNYETKINELKKEIQHDNNYDKLQQQLIILQMDLKVVQNDLNVIKELLE